MEESCSTEGALVKNGKNRVGLQLTFHRQKLVAGMRSSVMSICLAY